MRSLWHILRLIWRDRGAAMRRGLALTVVVSLFGIGLLALSGWFIVAAGIAGLAGLGTVFDVFRPSAGVRFLAIARTAARYGERLLTHDATLKALASLRVRLLAGVSAADFATLSRLRAGGALNRLTADIDALDGLAIRLIFPALAGLIASIATLIGLWYLVAPVVALWAVGVTVLGGVVVLVLAGRAAFVPASRAETRQQALRAGVIAHLRGRAQLVVAGRLLDSRNTLLDQDRAARRDALQQSRVEWRAGAMLQAVAAVALSGTLVLAGQHVLDGRIGPAQAALAVLATLAMAELTAALQRGAAELGRMRDAAGRVAAALETPPTIQIAASETAPGLQLCGLSVAPLPGLRPVVADLDLTILPGETVALTGPSGRGKTAVLNTVAGLVPAMSGRVRAGGLVGYLTQRPALIAGTVRDTLKLASPDADDGPMRNVLAACALDLPLDTRLGEGGAGLSGGQSRRLALARTLIRRPDILLLDEPTEGLDAPTAAAMMHGIREWLPQAAILIAAHRDHDLIPATRVVVL